MVLDNARKAVSENYPDHPAITKKHSPLSLALGLKGAIDQVIEDAPDYSKEKFGAFFRVHFLPEKSTDADFEAIKRLNTDERELFSKLSILTAGLDGMKRLVGKNFDLMIPSRNNDTLARISKEVGLDIA